MKISKTDNLEPPTTDDDNENIQLEIHEPTPNDAVEPAKKKRVYNKKPKEVKEEPVEVDELEEFHNSVDAPKKKRQMTEAQLLNWKKCLDARKASCERRKKEKEEAEKQRQADLENKIIVKAKRIKKAQERVLGDLDELKEDPEPVVVKQRKPRIKKQIIVYDNEDDGYTEESDYEPPKKKRRVAKPEPETAPPTEIPKPVLSKSIKFI